MNKNLFKPMMKVKNEAGGEVAELHLTGLIRRPGKDEKEEDCIHAKRVRKALEGTNGKTLNVYLNSPGGCVFESVAIHNMLLRHKGEVNIFIDALAGSGASVIAAAGDKINMYKNSMQMIHEAWTFVAGDAEVFRKAAGDLDKITNSFKLSYMRRFKGSTSELDKLLKNETFLSAEDCLEYGLCDVIMTENSQKVENSLKSMTFNLSEKQKKNLFAPFQNNAKRTNNLFAKYK